MKRILVYYAAEWLAGCLESTEVTNELMIVLIGGGGADESVKAVGLKNGSFVCLR